MLPAGRLNQKVQIQSPPSTRGSMGQRTGEWSNVVAVWAEAQPLKGRELFAAGTMQSEATVRFRIRWRAGISHDMRIVWRGVPHAIVGDPIDVDGGRHTLEIMTAAGGRDST
jgi:SPP1 family predicted phage head-tail adaptor